MSTEAAPVQAEAVDEAPVEGTEETQSKPKAKADTRETKSQPKAEPEAKEKGPHPWDEDLTARGYDPTEHPKLGEFMTERQGYTTQVEQQLAQWSELFGGDLEGAELMSTLLNELRTDPEAAFYELGELLGVLDPNIYDQTPAEGQVDVVPDEQAGLDATEEETLTPEQQFVRDQMEERRVAEEDQAFETLMGELGSEIGEGFEPELMTICLAVTDGDVNKAYEMYKPWHDRLAGPPAPEGDTPPPVAGDAGPTPRIQKQYSSLGDATQDWAAEERTRRGV